MVGPGTGVAPFRNFIHERAQENSSHSHNLLLFFGCRHPEYDFYCKNEFLSLEKAGKLTLITAFSRQHSYKT